MKKLPFQKYKPYPLVNMSGRTWPDKLITKAPAWCSVDLRDGNQALVDPMTAPQKMLMFKMLVELQFKEIEIGFPSASETEMQFCHDLVEQKSVPDDVYVQVLCQARNHLIEKTFEAIAGFDKVIFHIYNSTSSLQRDVVFKAGKEEIIEIALNGVRRIKELKDRFIGSSFVLQYSPESFTGTELDFSREICERVVELWDPRPDEKVILNLPATVEMSTPNIYADMIEWMCRNLNCREQAIISLHPHNDRGCAVAAAELGLMAGADRIEGTLFGNGERTGNVDLCTLAYNMYSQGIDPKLHLADAGKILEVCTACTGLGVHQRHPYVGELVYTAFSGSHQDAINKGFKAIASQREKAASNWEVPYLPIDPTDLGRTYEAVIRINSQSGKGGVAYILETNYGFKMPRALQMEFSGIVQQFSDKKQKEITSLEIKQLFYSSFIDVTEPLSLKRYFIETSDTPHTQAAFEVVLHGSPLHLKSSGNGPIDALAKKLKEHFSIAFRIAEYSESSLEEGSDARAACYIQIRRDDKTYFGVGIHSNTVTAALEALLRAVNRAFPELAEARTNSPTQL